MSENTAALIKNNLHAYGNSYLQLQIIHYVCYRKKNCF